MKNEFKHHFGRTIRSYIKSNDSLQANETANALNLTPSGFSAKMNFPYYGNVYDLLRVSIVLNHDFVSDALQILRDNGVPIKDDKKYEELVDLRTQVKEFKEDIGRYKKLIDRM